MHFRGAQILQFRLEVIDFRPIAHDADRLHAPVVAELNELFYVNGIRRIKADFYGMIKR